MASLRACLFGSVGALVSALLSFAVSYISGYELGIVWLFLGAAVGACVHLGSESRGGWGYSLLAVFLTYLAIGSSLTLLVVVELRKGDKPSEGASSAVRTFLPSLTAPDSSPSPLRAASPTPPATPKVNASATPARPKGIWFARCLEGVPRPGLDYRRSFSAF